MDRPPPHQAVTPTAARRRSLGRLAAMLALVVLSEMLVGLFATWSLERLSLEQYRETRQALAQVNHARAAQVQFKMQVQAWKNVLLRGAVPQDRDVWYETLVRHETEVRHHLDGLRSVLSESSHPGRLATLEAIVAEHRRVGAGYRAALQKAATETWQPHNIDAEVRGIDRPLDQSIDALADQLIEAAEHTLQASRDTAAHRFALLGHLLWWSAGLALALIAILIVRALRMSNQNP
jgi:methyl-accepting chemotaxis protein